MGIGTLTLYPWSSRARRLHLRQRWSRQLLDILVLRVHAVAPEAGQGRLLVANHVSWLDIFVINAVCPAAFIARAEVRRWPLIGYLAQQNETVFLERGSRGHARQVSREIAALLAAGVDVALFPEGKTSTGTHLLHFHAALLQAAIDTRRPLQPLAICYCTPSGRISTAPSFAGKTSLPRSLLRILACPSLTAHLVAAPVIKTAAAEDRRVLAGQARQAIGERLAKWPGFRPARNRPERAPGPPDELPSTNAPTDSPNRWPADWA